MQKYDTVTSRRYSVCLVFTRPSQPFTSTGFKLCLANVGHPYVSTSKIRHLSKTIYVRAIKLACVLISHLFSEISRVNNAKVVI